mmetsp:Transcript_64647/g.145837  ORF Transcript_64647/g.145837 Transcript_64647/m.145837 type:complete len:145 (-) Transcript_64647:403-837(-)|eukprot:CAMPEP_0172594006 /NCGR_PEP_ID=MMETSP1068-20121228/13266_1 /TAXON_ID=35684 /ORGANISM="Pseudopedinella elastica, Strain CCMP716" /LENGTH=144 /DNA_ID=CAMNT_0013391769 /DNA_START=195 /DNA_END=629 /DNA_ORIENTATION=+
MIIPKKNKILVYSYLFKEGCLVAPKDYWKAKHDEIDVPNREVMLLMKSLTSRGLVNETFNWQWFYWYLNDEGVEYMRQYLHLPEEYVPNTHKKKAGATPARVGPTPGDKPEGEDGGRGRGGGFGGEYRSEGGKGGKGMGRGGGF